MTDETAPEVRLLQEKSEDKARAADSKILSEQIKRVFFSPFSRMMRFIYTGISPRQDVLILGTSSEKVFRYGDPDQGLALVHLKDDILKNTLLSWFAKIGVDFLRLEIINIALVGSILNKCKWNMARVTASRDSSNRLVLTLDTEESVVVSEEVETLFSFQKIRYLTESYIAALVDKSTLVYSYPYRGDDAAQMSLVTLDTKELCDVGFLHLPESGSVRVIIRRGLDWLSVKDLPACTDSDFLGLRLWSPSGSSLFYVHAYDTSEMTLATTRCNFFLIPRHI